VRLTPFLVAFGIAFIVCLALFRLPDSFLAQLERNSPLSTAQAGWAFRLLALAATGQAFYGGFVILQIDRVRKAMKEDEKTAAMSPDEILRTLARTAAGMILLTLVYGIAYLFITGERGGLWLFVVVAVLQGAWYYRQVGQIAKWFSLQVPEPEGPRRESAWEGEPSDYSPPLGR
jgi:hypothetical protein